MFGRSRKTNRKRSPIICLGAGSILLWTGLATGGCNQPDIRGDTFPHDETFRYSGTVRPTDDDLECFGFSNKARQIEQNLGAR